MAKNDFKVMQVLNSYIGYRKYINPCETSEAGRKALYQVVHENYGIDCTFDEFNKLFDLYLGMWKSVNNDLSKHNNKYSL